MPDVQRETPDQPDVLAFLAAADERSASLYPAESRHGLGVSALLAAGARFFVARQGGRALGCGGYVRLPQQAAEMKRLFVDPAARGRGVGGAIVRAIEQAAAGEGVRTLFLETGVKSCEALRLYGRRGFARCGPFAGYRLDPLSVFMAKRLGEAGGAMRCYRRFARFDERALGPHEERLELAEVLGNAPGVSAVEVMEAHPRGGYVVGLDLAPDSIDAFGSYLAGFSWRFVM